MAYLFGSLHRASHDAILLSNCYAKLNRISQVSKLDWRFWNGFSQLAFLNCSFHSASLISCFASARLRHRLSYFDHLNRLFSSSFIIIICASQSASSLVTTINRIVAKAKVIYTHVSAAIFSSRVRSDSSDLLGIFIHWQLSHHKKSIIFGCEIYTSSAFTI